MRRMLSDGAIVRAAPSPAARQAAALAGRELQVLMPTEAEVRDAVARVSKSLDEMYQHRNAGGVGWVPGEFDFKVAVDADGGISVRGFLVIERPD